MSYYNRLRDILVKVGRNIVESSGFSDDSDMWFDKIVDQGLEDTDPFVEKIMSLVKVGSPATEKQLDKVESVLKTVPWSREVLKFISDMRAGMYSNEFKNFAGGNVGNASKSSMIAAFLNILRQAISYNF